MKKILLILLIGISSIVHGQKYGVGITLGNSNYSGDVGKTFEGTSALSGSLFFKYNYDDRITFRTSYSRINIEGNGTDSNMSFENNIDELELGVEFNLFNYEINSYNKYWTPYISTGIVLFNYKVPMVERDINGNIVIGDKIAHALPLGIGIKSILTGPFAFSIETKIRYTFEDDLDDIVAGARDDWYFFTGVSLIYTFGRERSWH